MSLRFSRSKRLRFRQGHSNRLLLLPAVLISGHQRKSAAKKGLVFRSVASVKISGKDSGIGVGKKISNTFGLNLYLKITSISVVPAIFARPGHGPSCLLRFQRDLRLNA